MSFCCVRHRACSFTAFLIRSHSSPGGRRHDPTPISPTRKLTLEEINFAPDLVAVQGTEPRPAQSGAGAVNTRLTSVCAGLPLAASKPCLPCERSAIRGSFCLHPPRRQEGARGNAPPSPTQARGPPGSHLPLAPSVCSAAQTACKCGVGGSSGLRVSFPVAGSHSRQAVLLCPLCHPTARLPRTASSQRRCRLGSGIGLRPSDLPRALRVTELGNGTYGASTVRRHVAGELTCLHGEGSLSPVHRRGNCSS